MTELLDTPAKVEPPQEPNWVTPEQMIGKKARTKKVSVILEEGDEPSVFLLKSIGRLRYDAMLTAAKHRPTLEQRQAGNLYNPNTFAPALLALCVVKPEMSEETWTATWASDEWAPGEISDLFFACIGLCTNGLELDPTAAG